MVDYSLIYRISAKIESAKKGFERIQGAFGNMTESGKIMGRRMGNLLTLQKLAWIGFAYIVAKSIFDIMRKSTVLQSFLSAWGTILGAIMDTLLAPWADELVWLTEKFTDLYEAMDKLPDWAKKIITGTVATIFAGVALGGLWILITTKILPALAALGLAFKGVIAHIAGLELAILSLEGTAALVVGTIGGLLLGLLGTWILVKIGAIDALVEMGENPVTGRVSIHG